MAIQVVDFSTIDTVTHNGVALTQVVIDGSTIWTSAYAGNVWQQKGQTITGAAASNNLGKSVAIDSAATRMVVGEPKATILGATGGQARVYDWNGTFWSLNTTFDQSYDGEYSVTSDNVRCGEKVDISSDGTVIAVRSNSVFNIRGIINTYETLDGGTTWTRTEKSGINGYNIGSYDCSISGTQLVHCGANGAYTATFSGTGLGNNFDATANRVCASSDGTVLVTAESTAFRNGFSSAGELRLYSLSGGAGGTTSQLAPHIKGTFENQKLGGGGVKVSSTGSRVAAASSAGVYIYDESGGLYSQTAIVTDPITPSNSVSSLDMSDDGLRIVFSTSNGTFAFDDLVGVWTLVGPPPSVTAVVGTSVSISGDTVAIGDLSNDDSGSDAGAAYTFNLV